jgi:hypothetical protein
MEVAMRRSFLTLLVAGGAAALSTAAVAQTTTTTVTQKPSEGAAVGVVGGAATGAALGGPVGAVVGAVAGGIAGAVVDPPAEVKTYVQSQTVPVVTYDGDIVVGRALPTTIGVYEVPNNARYSWAYVNGERVLIERASRNVVSVMPDGATAVTARTGSATAAAGLVGGAATGAAVGGPVGAAVGAVVGGVAGALADPPKEVTTYVRSQNVPVASYNGQIAVGRPFPSGVGVYDVPSDPRYRWSYVNGQRILIDGSTGAVVTVLP